MDYQHTDFSNLVTLMMDYSVLSAHCWVWKTFCLDSWASLCQAMLYLLLEMLCVFDCIRKYFSNTEQISNTCPMWFSILIHNISVFKYVFEPNPSRAITICSFPFNVYHGIALSSSNIVKALFLCIERVLNGFTVVISGHRNCNWQSHFQCGSLALQNLCAKILPVLSVGSYSCCKVNFT